MPCLMFLLSGYLKLLSVLLLVVSGPVDKKFILSVGIACPVQGIASYKNIQFCMIIIFYLKLDISARARAHACAQMCAAHKCAQCWNTGQAISEYNYKQDLYFISLCAFWAYMYTGTILRVKSEKFCTADAAKVLV